MRKVIGVNKCRVRLTRSRYRGRLSAFAFIPRREIVSVGCFDGFRATSRRTQALVELILDVR